MCGLREVVHASFFMRSAKNIYPYFFSFTSSYHFSSHFFHSTLTPLTSPLTMLNI